MMIITGKDKTDAERLVDQAWRQQTITAEQAQELRAMITGVPVGAAVRAPTLPILTEYVVTESDPQPMMVTRAGPYERLVLRND